ncbi:hypothetical protein ACFQFG_03795 [Methylobacterium persicinum]
MAASVRIQYLQWVAGAVAACGCAVLGGMQLTHAFAELNRADRAVAEASRFGLVLAMTDMISAERGPSNAAMDPFAASPEEGARRLAAIRATTDRRIAEVRAASEPGEAAQLASVFDVVGQRLAEARAKVDAVCARPPEERRGRRSRTRSARCSPWRTRLHSCGPNTDGACYRVRRRSAPRCCSKPMRVPCGRRRDGSAPMPS